MIKVKNEFPKRNELVALKGNTLSIYAHKTVDYIYKEGLKYYENKRDGGIFELNIYKLKEEIGMKSNTHKQIIKELEIIEGLSFETYDKKHYSKFSILSGFELKKDGILRVALSPFLIEKMMFNTENIYYHMSNLLESKHLRSKYSKRILDLHRRYHGSIPKLELKKFQDLMQYSENYRNGDIKLRVLEKAKKELKEKNNMILNWEIVKVGTKWKNIKLNIIELVEKNSDLLEFTEKLEKAIEKARKNRFIDIIYSHKAMQKIIKTYDEQNILKALREASTYQNHIHSFSKFLIAKIKDIENSKKKPHKIKEAEKVEEIPKNVSKIISEKSKLTGKLMKKKEWKLLTEMEEIKTLKALKIFIQENDLEK